MGSHLYRLAGLSMCNLLFRHLDPTSRVVLYMTMRRGEISQHKENADSNGNNSIQVFSNLGLIVYDGIQQNVRSCLRLEDVVGRNGEPYSQRVAKTSSGIVWYEAVLLRGQECHFCALS